MNSKRKFILKTGVAFIILLVVLMQGVFCYASEPESGSGTEVYQNVTPEITEQDSIITDETEIIEVTESDSDSELGYEVFVTGISESHNDMCAGLAGADNRMNMVIIGDSYTAGYGVSPEQSWAYQLVRDMGTSDSVIVGFGGTGFRRLEQGRDFTCLLRNALEEVDDPASVEWVITCGGMNDRICDKQEIYDSIVLYVANAKALFPNAKILIGHIGWEESVSTQDLLFDRSIPAYQEATRDKGVYYLSNGESVLANSPDSSYMDGPHPTAKGYTHLKEYVQRFLTNVAEGTDVVTVRYHRNMDPDDQEISEKQYPKDSVALENLFQETEENLVGWTRFKNYAFAQYEPEQDISTDGSLQNMDVIDLYAVWQLQEEGLKRYRGRWYWFDNGIADMSYFGVRENPYGWWYIRNGKVDFSYNGIAQDENGKWWIRNGQADLSLQGFISYDNCWYYVKNGKLVTGWQKDGNTWYYMDSSGVMQTGWIYDGSCWYYLNSSGEMQTGWQEIGGKWYYLDPSGAMQTGWQKIGGKWYYLDPSGVMQTGWIYDGSYWYYMDPSGAMQTGWQGIGGKWYYLKSSGAMADREWYGGYWFSYGGAWTYQPMGSWKQGGAGWWFGDTSGWYAKNEEVKINDVWYRFDANGYWIP